MPDSDGERALIAVSPGIRWSFPKCVCTLTSESRDAGRNLRNWRMARGPEIKNNLLQVRVAVDRYGAVGHYRKASIVSTAFSTGSPYSSIRINCCR